MNKGTFWDDTFEKALEAGQQMAKSGTQQIKQTFNPFNMLKNSFGGESANGQNGMNAEMKKMQEKMGEKKATPLDFAKLQEKYNNQDKAKTDALRNRLFQMVKSGDEKILAEKKQKEQEKIRTLAWEEQEKKRREAEKARQAQMSAEPQGKERQSILAPKKKKKRGVEPSPAEIKPSTGKQ